MTYGQLYYIRPHVLDKLSVTICLQHPMSDNPHESMFCIYTHIDIHKYIKILLAYNMNIAHSTHCTIIITRFNIATWIFIRSTVLPVGKMIDGPSHVRTQGRHLRDFSAVFGIASGNFSNIGPYYLRNWTFSRRYRAGHTHFTLFTANWDVLNICDDSADVIALQFSYSASISALFLQVFMAEIRLALSLLRFKF